MNEQKDKIKMPIIVQCQNAMHDLPFHWAVLIERKHNSYGKQDKEVLTMSVRSRQCVFEGEKGVKIISRSFSLGHNTKH